MILKKPYAFLIKHFKLIHLLLAMGLIYIVIKFNGLLSFFNSYLKNGYYSNINTIARTSITFYVYLVVLLVLVLGIIIYILFKQKEKPKKFYSYLIIYYIVIFILFTFFLSVLKDMEVNVIDIKTLRIYRDITLLFSLPQYFFIIINFLRGIGFDYKKFNFSKDISELKIDIKDNEEFELNIDVENYKLKRRIRRFFRELKYYIAENTFMVITISSILIVVVATLLFLNRNVYNKIYKEEQSFTLNNFKINVLDSIITPYSYNGETITKNKNYLVVLYNVTNISPVSAALNLEDFRLLINNQNIYPAINNREFFIDIGKPYYEEKLKPKTNQNIVMIYELNKDQVKNTYLLNIEDNINYAKGEIVAKYKQIELKPNKIINVVDENSVKLNEVLDFKNSNIKNSKITITDYQFIKSYKYNYEFCYNNNCYESTNVVEASYKTEKEKTLLILNYNLILDENTAYYNNISSDKLFFNQFLKLKYVLKNKNYISKINNKTPGNLKNALILEVDSEIKKSDNVTLVFTIRNKEYNIILK